MKTDVLNKFLKIINCKRSNCNTCEYSKPFNDDSELQYYSVCDLIKVAVTEIKDKEAKK